MSYRLIPDTVSHDTVEALETLLELARQGEITGIAYGCTMKKSRFFTNVAGYCWKNPTFTRGLMGSLDDDLGRLVRTRDIGETR